MQWLRKAPTSVIITVIIAGALGGIAVLGGYIALDLHDEDTGGYLQFVTAMINLILLPLMGVGTLASVSAARSAAGAEQNTNGTLSAKDREIAGLRRALTDKESA